MLKKASIILIIMTITGCEFFEMSETIGREKPKMINVDGAQCVYARSANGLALSCNWVGYNS